MTGDTLRLLSDIAAAFALLGIVVAIALGARMRRGVGLGDRRERRQAALVIVGCAVFVYPTLFLRAAPASVSNAIGDAVFLGVVNLIAALLMLVGETRAQSESGGTFEHLRAPLVIGLFGGGVVVLTVSNWARIASHFV